MYATIRSYASDGGLVDALVENEGAVRDLLTGIDGFRAYYILRTPGGGAVSISVYDDAAGARGLERRARQAGCARTFPISPLAALRTITAGEVAVTF